MRNKSTAEKFVDLHNAWESLKYHVLIALPFSKFFNPVLKQQIILEYPQAYCYDRHGICEYDEVCYCNRQLCPNHQCEQLLTSLSTTDESINCHHCGAQITILKI